MLTLILGLVKGKSRVINIVYRKLRNWILYNPILRIVIESYLELSLAIWIQVLNLQFDNGIHIFQSVWALLMIVVMFLYPLLIPVFLIKKRSLLDSEDMRLKYECLYEGCNVEKTAALLQ